MAVKAHSGGRVGAITNRIGEDAVDTRVIEGGTARKRREKEETISMFDLFIFLI